MIPEDLALRRIADLGPEDLRDVVRRRLMGEDVVPVASPYGDEPPEDLVIALLTSSQVVGARRNSVIAGCQDVYSEMLRRQASVQGDRSADTVRTVVRLGRVVDLTTPDELRSRAQALLDLMVVENNHPTMLRAAVRAVMNYPKRPADGPFWERVATRPETAAYGIAALTDIDALSPRLEELLVQLWRRQLEERWPIDGPFLVRRASMAAGSTALIVRVVERLSEQCDRRALAEDLRRRPWSRRWLRYVSTGPPRLMEANTIVLVTTLPTRGRIIEATVEQEGMSATKAMARSELAGGPGLEELDFVAVTQSLEIIARSPDILEEVQMQ